jgi:preprotein translocase subunit SecD
MKTIFNIIITTVICIILTSAIQKPTESTKSVILQSTGNNVTSALLAQSAKIISARLGLYGLTSFTINVLADKGQIEVQMADNTELSEIEGLLISRGELAFYETYNRNEIAVILKNSDHLFTLLKSDPGKSLTDPRLGCAAPEDFDLANEYLRSLRLIDSCRLFWGLETDKSLKCLFALKINTAGKPLIVKSDVEAIKSSGDKVSQSSVTEIKLKPAAISIFANATKKNLNKAIAIVIDDKVFYYPTVRNVIDSGEIEISGKLTEKQVNYFLALVNNDLLPLSFKVLK